MPRLEGPKSRRTRLEGAEKDGVLGEGMLLPSPYAMGSG